MNEDPTTRRAVAALLEVIAADRETRCRAIVAPAEQAAASEIAAALAATRRQLRQTLQNERARLRAERQNGQAQLAAALRQRQQHLAQTAIDQGLALLRPALLRRWQQPRCRQRWIAQALAIALRRLPPGNWCIRHPPGLAADELADEFANISRQLAAAGIDDVRCELAAELVAGIEVVAGDARLDASADGLLADRATVSGRLLHFWSAADDGAAATATTAADSATAAVPANEEQGVTR